MKKFICIILLAVAAVLTTCTPCEAKGKHETVVASVFVKNWLPLCYDSCNFSKSDMIACDAAINASKDMSGEIRRITHCDDFWMEDVYIRKTKVRDVVVLECYCCSPVCYDDYRPDATEFFERLQDVEDERFRTRYEFYRQVILK